MKLMLEVKVAWWLTPYIYALALFSEIVDREIDSDRLDRVIAKAITVRPSRQTKVSA